MRYTEISTLSQTGQQQAECMAPTVRRSGARHWPVASCR